MRRYSELVRLHTFLERFRYLKLDNRIGEATFGPDRYLNQAFYMSREWKQVRHQIILRDNACDLGCADREIHGKILIHHMNPLTLYDFVEGSENLLNPEYLICVCERTHNAIHFSDESILHEDPITRRPNDTIPWK